MSHTQEFVDKIKQVLINGGVEVNNIPGLSQIFHSQSSAANACEMFAQSKKNRALCASESRFHFTC